MTNIFLKIYQNTVAKYLIKKNNITVYGKQFIERKTPYVLLANHVNNWDPFFILAFSSDIIDYVTNDAFFKNRILSFLLKYFRAIPKKKFISDLDTIKKIIKAAKKGHSIGIFPEGRRTWDGISDEIPINTSKLIKKIGLPVVTCRIKGGMLAFPRWASYSRKGHVELEFNEAISKEALKQMTAFQIHITINNYIKHNEMQWQAANMYSYKGENLAERLERFLYICPKCVGINTLFSKGNDFNCSCGYKVTYNEYGFFDGEEVIFNNTSTWNQWQTKETVKLLKNDMYKLETFVEIEKEDKDRNRETIKTAIISYNEGFVSLNYNENQEVIKPEQIIGSNVKSNCKWQFYYSGYHYTISFKKRETNAYQWYLLVKLIKEMDSEAL